MSVPNPAPPATPAAGDADAVKVGVRALLRGRGFRRLLISRVPAQWGDGFFQAALGGAVLFNPERQADPLAVAAGLAVMLLPYSFVGPFAGALLDRWDRRRVLLLANLLRGVLIALVAVAVGTGVAGPPLYLGALAVVGVSRFVGAGLSAALPHVVEPRNLVEANVVASTAGAASAALGGVMAIGVRELVGPGDAGSGVTTALAVVGSLVAALAAAGFAKGVLGPDGTEARSRVAAVARGWLDGARAVVRVPTASAAFCAVGAHRLAFGTSTLLSLLLFRYAFHDSGIWRAGLAGVGQVVTAAGAGIGVAALVTPWLTHRLGRATTVRTGLVVAALAQVGVAVVTTIPTVLAGAFVLSTAGQVVKLCADATIQQETADEARGRVFALYDALFNTCYVVAVAAAALLAPPDGDSPWLLGSAAVVYLLGLAGHETQLRRRA
ncbi:MFS transporter [Pseudonocardia sp. RS11V-5]|uniref:MFS transporter n=1 Tax=Pseudonocardia terrae TaxID=2905831 RepID=UPI001E4F9392|nr:MFS transporter [Pseudonocardia terrae]MCE3553540.1 MFS transporter [Pseudonocardia terrae]